VNKEIKILSLNIGNPSLERAKRQCEWLKERPEDIFVLTETKCSGGCEYIENFFFQYGFQYFYRDHRLPGANDIRLCIFQALQSILLNKPQELYV